MVLSQMRFHGTIAQFFIPYASCSHSSFNHYSAFFIAFLPLSHAVGLISMEEIAHFIFFLVNRLFLLSILGNVCMMMYPHVRQVVVVCHFLLRLNPWELDAALLCKNVTVIFITCLIKSSFLHIF